MNAEMEVERLLKEAGMTPVRGKKHVVYRLPNGSNFVRSHTPGDRRAARNDLAVLRRALEIERPIKTQKAEGETAMPQNQPATEPLPMAVPVAPPAPPTARMLNLPQASLKDRIEAAIVIESAEQTRLMAEAEAIDRRVQMLRAMLPFAADASTENALRALLPVAAPPPQYPSEPPKAVVERVQVTRQLVFAATQTFADAFTINDVLDALTKGRRLDKPERLRVRSSITSALRSLMDRGEVILETHGIGKRESTWRRANLNGDVPVRVECASSGSTRLDSTRLDSTRLDSTRLM